MEGFPWPWQLGIVGVCLFALVGQAVWYQRRKAQTYDQAQVEQMLKDRDASWQIRVDAANAIAKLQEERGDEWRQTASVEKERADIQTEIAQKATDSNKTLDYLLSQIPVVRKTGDNVTQGVIEP